MRRCWRIGFAVAVGSLPAAMARAQGPFPIVWEPATGPTVSVRVVNLPAATLRSLQDAAETDPRWPTILAVRVVTPDLTVPPDRPAILGKYRIIDGTSVRFTPRFPLDATRRYRVTVDPDGATGDAPALTVDRAEAPQAPTTPTVVTRVEPVGDRLPENLLKFYLSFSAPMSRGDAYSHLSLIAADGHKVDRPFLELGEELWDATQTRLTVFLDPGRIKRGLRPREELGPILTADQTYTLQVDPTWRDATGQPLGARASKRFTTTPADETSPDPKTWTVISPQAGSTDPLIVRFDDTLDRATVASGLNLVDPQSAPTPGTAEAALDGTAWRFTPEVAWSTGTYHLQVATNLEDLAGNSIRRPFEVDVQRDVPVIPEVNHVRLPVVIRR